ncbi:serine/threonine-protein kinase AtPK2/AtPK19 [Lactuca sativa]|uniref:serine/threonine-protein kinase AtPK2/AtPK19 n=1 Tax=Lactuca sativa TaxID=4236 RepID=UPI0022AEFC43|nr:serine/threonine-protein kinase AtPK2/AtPK19 [Lactuca sativa]
MVSSQLTALIENKPFKSSKNYFQFPKNPPNETSDTLELDFSDTFGPLPLPAGNSEIPSDDPVVIYSRSHSLVGPTPCVSHLLNLRKLTICETDESLEDFSDVIDKEIEEEDSENGCKVKTIGLEDFEVMKVVGQGAFGKVYQVRKRDSLEIYAMKVVRKDKIVEKNHAEYMKAERDILTKIDHPFIVQLRYSFQLYHHGLFREDLARIYAAEIVSAVSHLHANGIMHRDLKPENILLDVDGHALLTDFGLAKEFDENARSNSLCGTVEYMSPEIILGKGHDKAADWWSVGIFFYMTRGSNTPLVPPLEVPESALKKNKGKVVGESASSKSSPLKNLNSVFSKKKSSKSGASSNSSLANEDPIKEDTVNESEREESEFGEDSDLEGEFDNTMANIDEVPMGEWKKRIRDDTGPGLVQPVIPATATFELKGHILAQIKEIPFYGKDHEDDYKHLDEVNDGAAKDWLKSLPPGSITTWAKMKEEFIDQFCPPSIIESYSQL